MPNHWILSVDYNGKARVKVRISIASLLVIASVFGAPWCQQAVKSLLSRPVPAHAVIEK